MRRLALSSFSVWLLRHFLRDRGTKLSAASLRELDAQLVQAGSLAELLASREKLDLYFETLKRYFGGKRLTRESFDAVIAQLREAAEALPELAARLWRMPGSKEFSIRIAATPSGRTLNYALWRMQRARWVEDLRARAGLLAVSGEQKELKRGIGMALGVIQARIDSFEEGLTNAKLKKRDRLDRRGKFYKRLRGDRDLQRAAAYCLHDYLIKHRGPYFFELRDADLLLDFLRDLRQSPREAIPSGFPAPHALCSHIKSLIPDPRELLEDGVLFPSHGPVGGQRGVAVANYVTRPVRPLHAIFVGCLGYDCVGGAPGYLAELTPRRWAVSAIEGSVTHFTERDGAYEGFSRVFPISLAGETYGALEVAVPSLGNKIVIDQPGRGGRASAIFFDLWLESYLTIVPREVRGIVISQSLLIDIAQVKPIVLLSPHYLFGEAFGAADEIGDPMVARLLARFPAAGLAKSYGTGMLCDPWLVDSGELRKLVSIKSRALNTERLAAEEGGQRVLDYLACV